MLGSLELALLAERKWIQFNIYFYKENLNHKSILAIHNYISKSQIHKLLV